MLLPITYLKITQGWSPLPPQHTQARPIVPAHGNGITESTDSLQANAPGTVFYTHERMCTSKQRLR